MLSGIVGLKISHVCREANMMADYLAFLSHLLRPWRGMVMFLEDVMAHSFDSLFVLDFSFLHTNKKVNKNNSIVKQIVGTISN